MTPLEKIQLSIFLTLKKKKKLHFITLNYTPNYTLYPKLWISIQANLMLWCKV